MRDNDGPDQSRQQPDRQQFRVAGRLFGRTSIDDRLITLTDIPGYIDWIDWFDGGD